MTTKNAAQTKVSTDRDDDPGSTRAHEGAPAPEDVTRPAPTPQGPDAVAAATANIGVVGLAVMGSNLARNLASREGNTVAIYNRSHAKTETLRLISSFPLSRLIVLDAALTDEGVQRIVAAASPALSAARTASLTR